MGGETTTDQPAQNPPPAEQAEAQKEKPVISDGASTFIDSLLTFSSEHEEISSAEKPFVRQLIIDHLEANKDGVAYLNSAQKEILSSMTDDEAVYAKGLLDSGDLTYSTDQSIDKYNFKATLSPTQTTEIMGVFKDRIFVPLCTKIQERREAAEKQKQDETTEKDREQKEKTAFGTRLDTIGNAIMKFEEHKDKVSDDKINGEIAKLKQDLENAKVDTALTEDKVAALEKRLTDVFSEYKKAFLDGLGETDKDLKDALKDVNDPYDFFTDLETHEKADKETPPAESQDKGFVIDALTSFGMSPEEAKAIQEKNPFLCLLIGVLASFGFLPKMVTDPIYKKMSETDLREVYLDLNSKDQRWKSTTHDAKDTGWGTHKTNKEKAKTWLSSSPEFKDIYKSGRDEGMLRSLLASDYTVGDFKTKLVAGGDDETALEESDLPKEYKTSFPFVKALHEKVMAREGTKTDNDSKTLSEYIAIVLAQESGTDTELDADTDKDQDVDPSAKPEPKEETPAAPAE